MHTASYFDIVKAVSVPRTNEERETIQAALNAIVCNQAIQAAHNKNTL